MEKKIEISFNDHSYTENHRTIEMMKEDSVSTVGLLKSEVEDVMDHTMAILDSINKDFIYGKTSGESVLEYLGLKVSQDSTRKTPFYIYKNNKVIASFTDSKDLTDFNIVMAFGEYTFQDIYPQRLKNCAFVFAFYFKHLVDKRSIEPDSWYRP